MQSPIAPEAHPIEQRVSPASSIDADREQIARLMRKVSGGLDRDGFHFVPGSTRWCEPCLGRWAQFGRHWNEFDGKPSARGTHQCVRQQSSLWWSANAPASVDREPERAAPRLIELPASTAEDALEVIAGEPIEERCFHRLATFCAGVLPRRRGPETSVIETRMVRLREINPRIASASLRSLAGILAPRAAIVLIARSNLILGSIKVRLNGPGGMQEFRLFHPQDAILLDFNRITVGPLSWMCADDLRPGNVDFLIVQPSSLAIAGPCRGPLGLS